MAIFGGIMGLIECLNSLGVAFSSNSSGSSSKQNLGSHLTIAAVAIQIGIILAFFCLASLFHRRCAKANVLVRSVNVMLITLYLSMSLILVRCVYRLVEHAGNTSVEYKDMKSMKKLSPIVRYEVFFYVFEASLMFLNSALWSLCNPGRFLPRNYSIYLGQDGTEVQGQKDVDTRSVPAQLVNILTFGLLCGRKRGDSYAEVTPDELEGGPESSDGHGMPVKQSNEPSTVETTIANVLTFGLWSLSQRRKKAPEAERLDEYPIAQRQ